jgi:hypothetical protein
MLASTFLWFKFFDGHWVINSAWLLAAKLTLL